MIDELELQKKLIIIDINLQLFADDDKTEDATQKKRDDARKKGQVYHSKELTGSLVLLSIIMSLKIFGSYMYQLIESFFKKVFTEYVMKDYAFTTPEVMGIFFDFLNTLLRVLLPLFVVVLIIAIGSQLAQIGILFTTDTLGVKFERINPLKGFKRMFSMNAFVELIKSILKILLIGYIAYYYLKQEVVTLIWMMDMEAMPSAVVLMDIIISVALRMAITLFILGIFDFMYQLWSYEKSLKMTKKEIKDEYKQQEGNPEIKAKIKQRQRQISMRRMMQDVPKADVVITNPTHFAVAIKYDPKKSDAPYVIAKGQDYLAKRIKEVAKENRIEIVENKPLARAIYSSVEVGKAIPQDLYQAVAEVLAFVFSLKGKSSAS